MREGLLKGKKGIIFGALNEKSIAWQVALKAWEQGAELILTNSPVALRLGTITELAKITGGKVIIADATKMEDDEVGDFKQIFINPIMVKQDGDEWAFEEGCLSIPEIREEVFRQENLTIKFFDEKWQPHERTYDGLKARIIQHEYDHIEGILFTDHLTPFKKRLLKGKLVNISKGKVKPKYRIKAPLAK